MLAALVDEVAVEQDRADAIELREDVEVAVSLAIGRESGGRWSSGYVLRWPSRLTQMEPA